MKPMVWNMPPCSMVERYQHFTGTCCLCVQDRSDTEDEGRILIQNISNYTPYYTEAQSRRLKSSAISNSNTIR
jgi:hypothetical protein